LRKVGGLVGSQLAVKTLASFAEGIAFYTSIALAFVFVTGIFEEVLKSHRLSLIAAI
jgi:hypothetical protein